jgi:hypothetical protein
VIADKTLDKYRNINVEHIDWWDSTRDMFKEDMKEQGIYVIQMYFSGFWSQGDGACFDGQLDDVPLFIEKNFKPDDYPMIRKLLGSGGTVTFNVSHNGHYYHENSTSFSIDADRLEHCIKIPTDFHEQIVEQWDMELDNEIVDFEKQSVEIFKNHMRTLYRTLAEEYDYLTSDEAVKETVIANDLNVEEDDADSESVLYPT